MKVLVTLLALLGLGLAFKPNVRYTYEYKTRLATAIPSTRSTVSGTGLQFNILIEMKTKSEAVVKFVDVKVGDYLGDVPCGLREEMPIKYEPMPQDQKTQLEQTFHVNLAAVKENMLVVGENEEPWVTNIKKSVVNHLRNAAIRANFGKIEGDSAFESMMTRKDDFAPISFTISEDTIMGRCPSRYSVTHLPHFLGVEEYDNIHHSHTDNNSDDLKLWRVVRHIDFNRCQDAVSLQSAPTGKASYLGNNYLQSRTSVTQYYLQGLPGDFVLQRMISEGSTTVQTYGYESSNVEAYSNQTMRFVNSVTSTNELTIPSTPRKVDTWKFEVTSPFHSSDDQSKRDWVHFKNQGEYSYLDWIDAVSGVTKSVPTTEEFKAEFIEDFEDAIQELIKWPTVNTAKLQTPFDTENGRAVYRLWKVSRITQSLPVKDISEIYDTIYNKPGSKETTDLRKMLISDVIAASGSRNAMVVLLSKFKAGSISPARASSIFMTMTNNAYNFHMTDEIIDFLKDLNLREHPFFATSALINTAQLAYHHCVSSHHKNHTIPRPLLGVNTCHLNHVVEKMLPMLKQKLESCTSSWERAVYLQAIGNLGTPEVINTLQPYIYGKKDVDSTVRSTAMYGLGSWKLPSSSRSQVFEILMPIITNVGEDSSLRQRAIKLIMSWNPDQTTWETLAAMTWHEPSRQVATFITSTIYTTATYNDQILGKQMMYAKKALRIAKKITPSLRYSYNIRASKFSRISQFLTSGELTWITNKESVIPHDVDAFFFMNLGGLNYKIFDLVLHTEGLQEPLYRAIDTIQRNIHNANTGHNVHNSDVRKIEDIYQQFLDAVVMDDSEHIAPHGSFFMKFFDNMQNYFHLNSDVVKILAPNGRLIPSELSKGIPIHMTKFLNPYDSTTAVPTDAGLPLIAGTATPVIQIAEGNVQFAVDGIDEPSIMELLTAKKVHASVDIKYKYISKIFSGIKIIVPWTQKIIGAGIEKEKQLNLPILIKADYSTDNDKTELKITGRGSPMSKYPIVYAHNLPMVFTQSMWSLKKVTPQFNILHANMDKTNALDKVTKKFGSTFVGIAAEIEWEGDYYYPINTANAFKLLNMDQQERYISSMVGLNPRQYRMSVNIDPKQCTTNLISTKFTHISPETTIEGSSDEPLTTADSNVQVYQKLRTMIHKENQIETPFRVLLGELSFTGSESKKYSAFAAATAPLIKDNQEKKAYLLGLMRSQLSPSSYSPKEVCLAMHTTSPVISEYINMETLLEAKPHVDLNAKILPFCKHERSVADIQVDIHLSDRRKEHLIKESREKTCVLQNGVNPCNDYPVDAVYDEVTLDVKYQKEIPEYIRNATYLLGDATHGALFPHIYSNNLNVNNPENKFAVKIAHRPLESHFWTVDLEFPHKRVIVDRIYVPEIMDLVLPIGGALTPALNLQKILLAEPTSETKCVIEANHVRTFDGYEYSPENSIPCWTVAAKNRTNIKNWVLETRFTQGVFLTRITSVNPFMMIEMKEGEVTVNGVIQKIEKGNREPIKDQHDHIVAYVTNINDKYAVEVPHELKVFMEGGKAYIYTDMRYKGNMCGLCGNYNEERLFETEGPKHCLYNNPDTFVKSWVSEATLCPKFVEYKKDIVEYQKNCHFSPTHTRQPYRTSEVLKTFKECQKYVYQIKEIKNEGKICVQAVPSVKCLVGCTSVSVEHSMTKYKCWNNKEAPADVIANLGIGFMMKPEAKSPQTYRDLHTEQARMCSQKK